MPREAAPVEHETAPAAEPAEVVSASTEPSANGGGDGEPDWTALHSAITGQAVAGMTTSRRLQRLRSMVQSWRRRNDATLSARRSPFVGQARCASVSGVTSGRRMEEKAAARESTTGVDTARLDQVLNLSGEIGLTKNRLTSLRADILVDGTIPIPCTRLTRP